MAMTKTKLADKMQEIINAWLEAQRRWREATPMQRAKIGLATRKSKTRFDRGKHKKYVTLNKAHEQERRIKQAARHE